MQPQSRTLRAALFRALTRHRNAAWARVGTRIAEQYLAAMANHNYDIEFNGEQRVIEVLGRGQIRCAFDVGANAGDWTLRARRRFPVADIHAFEIVPATFARLASTVRGDARVKANAFGLADREGTLPVAYPEDDSELATIVLEAARPNLAHVFVESRVRRGDDYCRETGVEHIDFLKIDVEGAEAQVLAGFQDMLGRRAIDVIQFEYGRANIVSRWLLRDAHAFMTERGYQVGKIYPDRVEFRPYQLEDEDFRGPNYLAVRSDLRGLIDNLAAR